MKIKVVISSVALLIVLSSVLMYCSSTPEGPYNVLLIIVDTLRPDRLSYSGRPISPNIGKLADDGVIFKNCYSQSGWTLPSIATILCGEYPKNHGSITEVSKIRDTIPMLAEILSENGYDTRGFASHIFLTPSRGFARGFSHYDYTTAKVVNPDKASTSMILNNKTINNITGMKEPYFLMVHYFDPHWQYLSYRQYDYGDRDIDRYDAEISHTDFYIGKLLDHLEEKNLLEKTIIVFIGDHGEEFGEHGGDNHHTLYNEVVLCPLVISAPFLKHDEKETIAEQIDIVPTILGMLDIEHDYPFPGSDLFSDEQDTLPVFMERDNPGGTVQRSIVEDNLKLMRIEVDSTELLDIRHRALARTTDPVDRAMIKSVGANVYPGIFMYDLSADPGETRNIFLENSEKAEELLIKLSAHFEGETIPAEQISISPEIEERLRQLGYIH
ncbi:MAG: sulfatase-like hydrolase/transferase [candidate division Zixibacteria bacterium]|nr:sulfatase-like hydrolase/transferase [candidate division Zixibacteria bacterium]